MLLEARAKINWTLDVLGRSENGYHQLDMLMQPVTLCDRIALQPADELRLEVTGPYAVTADERNLAWRAAAALREATGCRKGARITVEKHIPVQAGMGGGSADAAGVLWGLNRLWETGLAPDALERLGLSLGADVPFCLRGGLCRARGVGERLERAEDAPSYALCVIQPCPGLSTGEIFRAWHQEDIPLHVRTEDALRALRQKDWTLLDSLLRNALQPVSEKKRPEIREAIEALKAQGAAAALMTGSGSAVFGVFRDREAAGSARDLLRQRWRACYVCESCSSSLALAGD